MEMLFAEDIACKMVEMLSLSGIGFIHTRLKVVESVKLSVLIFRVVLRSFQTHSAFVFLTVGKGERIFEIS